MVSTKRSKINSEITLLNMKFLENFLAGAGAKITGVCSAIAVLFYVLIFLLPCFKYIALSPRLLYLLQ